MDPTSDEPAGTVPEGYAIRPAHTGDEREAVARVTLAVTPEHARTAFEIVYDEQHHPGGTRLLAWHDGEPVAYGGGGRITHYAPAFDGWWVELAVLAQHRGRGVGSELYARVSQAAGAAGKSALHALVSEAEGEGIAWLARRGFREWERTRRVELDLGAADLPSTASPEGIEIVSLAERPDLLPGIHAVALESFADIPGSDEAHVAGDYDEWIARSVTAPGILPEAFFVALADGGVAGYASLELPGAHPHIAWHDMTAVARAQRGRGIATALKRATIAWARAAGLERLQTENNSENASMRAVNARLGYQPLPDEIVLRGPLAPTGRTDGARRTTRAR